MMKMQVDKVVRVVDSQAIPDGEFLGIWGGFDARFEAGGCIFIAKTKAAMKGNVPCTVVVSRGKVVVRTERRYG